MSVKSFPTTTVPSSRSMSVAVPLELAPITSPLRYALLTLVPASVSSSTKQVPTSASRCHTFSSTGGRPAAAHGGEPIAVAVVVRVIQVTKSRARRHALLAYRSASRLRQEMGCTLPLQFTTPARCRTPLRSPQRGP